MKFFIKDFFSKYDQISSFLRSHLPKKSLMENFIFCAVYLDPLEIEEGNYKWACVILRKVM